MEYISYVDDGNITHYKIDGTDVLTVDEQINLETGDPTLICEGELVSSLVNDFSDEVKAFLTMGRTVTIDLAGVSKISYNCCNALLDLQLWTENTCKGAIMIRSVPDSIMNEFEKIGLNELLPIE